MVFSFKTVQEADQHFKILAAPVNSQDFCNGKSPERLVKMVVSFVILQRVPKSLEAISINMLNSLSDKRPVKNK